MYCWAENEDMEGVIVKPVAEFFGQSILILLARTCQETPKEQLMRNSAITTAAKRPGRTAFSIPSLYTYATTKPYEKPTLVDRLTNLMTSVFFKAPE
jgi:hypothetical protein